ncbi:MAG: alpha-glucan family phosphorylase, partial [Bacteroidetes bacterium]
ATTWQRLSQDESFLQEMQQVYQRFERYMAQPLREDVPSIAYLCMEYGLSRCLPFYAGGLGVLAGDYLKEASDAAYPLTAIGLLYRRGYFTQRLSPEGEQIAETPPIRFTDLPLQPVREADGRWLRLRIGLGTQPLYLKVWQVQVGRLSLYLLDADLPENPEELRSITHSLYAGQAELRLQQELVLGLGAQALIEALQLPIALYHYNEGHPAFHLVAHLAYWRRAGLALPEALERVRAATLFTTHTPVPAGHDAFSPTLLRPYLQPLLEEIGVAWETFLAWGEMPNEPERFSLTAFCLRFAARTNAVSQLHAQVSRRMFASLYPGYLPAEVPIQGITNGVHLSTWRAPEWQQSRRLWETHQTLKTQLLAYLRRRLSRQPWPVPYLQAVQAFFASTDENTLLLGFARRFAPYKRHWDFIASEDFARLLTEKPLRLLVAGKAHPQDEAGKAALQNLWQKLLQPPYQGKVLFVPDYDMELARWLVQGVDVWVNFPIYGQEASGTSGMKAALNGVLHLSLPDGWWAEVPAEAAGGWTIPVCTVSDPAIRNAWEATQAAFLLQESVLPTYLNRDPRGLPLEWIARMEKAQQYALTHFTTSRMLSQYLHSLYLPLAQRLSRITDPTLAQKRQHLLTQLATHWPSLTVKEVWAPPFAERAHPASEPFSIGVVVDLGPLPPEALRAELVLEKSPQEVILFPLNAEAPGRYTGHLRVEDPGVYHWAIRLYAWDPYLEERLWPW